MISIKNTLDRFSLKSKVCIITGGSGLLGIKHAQAVLDASARVVLLDINEKGLEQAYKQLSREYNKTDILPIYCDITCEDSILSARDVIINTYKNVHILINNASNNPKVEDAGDSGNWSRFENFDIKKWQKDLDVGLTGAFLCSQVFGSQMAENKQGVIINISSDLGIIAPDQRLYREDGIPEQAQNVKPVTYSVVKHGILGLTKYLATYWANDNVRVNAICPGGVYNGQPDDFLNKLQNVIPMGRMADADEYKAAILFLASDASSYMTGGTLVIDGGRTCW